MMTCAYKIAGHLLAVLIDFPMTFWYQCFANIVFVGIAGMGSLVAGGIVSPAPGMVTQNPFPSFRWQAHTDAFRDVAHPVEYEIRISREASGEWRIVDEDRVALNRYVHDRPLEPGRYRWQLRAHHRGAAGTWSEESFFTIREAERVLSVDPDLGLIEGFRDVLKQVDAKKIPSARIVIPPGDYRLDSSFQGYLFDVSGRSNLVIDGRGARVRFATRKQGLMLAKDAADIVIQGFDCSYAKGCLRVQGTVLSIDPAGRRMTLAVDEGFPGFDVSDNTKQDILYLLEPGKNGRLKTAAPSFLRANGPITRGSDGTWIFPCARELGFCRVGDRYGFNFRSGSLHLVDASGAHGVTASGLTTNGWGGMQFVSIEGGDMRLLHCKARLGEVECMSGNADGVHIRGHDMGPWIEGVEINAIGDDAIALYARPSTIKTVAAEEEHRAVLCRSEWFNLAPGDDVSFFQPSEGRILLETRVEKVIAEKGVYRVSFVHALPDGIRCEGPVQQATQIWNRSKSCGDFMVRNSRFTNIRRYGTVFRSRRGVVENNHYESISSRAVVFRNEAEWPNGLYASEIIIRGNTMIDIGFDNPGLQPAVAFLFSGYQRAASGIGPRHILIERNTFEKGSKPEMQFTGTRDVVLRGNRVKTAEGSFISTKYQARNSEEIRDGEP